MILFWRQSVQKVNKKDTIPNLISKYYMVFIFCGCITNKKENLLHQMASPHKVRTRHIIKFYIVFVVQVISVSWLKRQAIKAMQKYWKEKKSSISCRWNKKKGKGGKLHTFYNSLALVLQLLKFFCQPL